MIEFDLNGRRLALEETVVRELRESALGGAGSSSTLNDLAVILARALSEEKPMTLDEPNRGPWNVCLSGRHDPRFRDGMPAIRSRAAWRSGEPNA
jgi:hypothetical protein